MANSAQNLLFKSWVGIDDEGKKFMHLGPLNPMVTQLVGDTGEERIQNLFL